MSKVCFLSVDVEHDVATFENKKFDGVANLEKILSIFQKFNLPATLFVTGDVLEGFADQAKLWAQRYEIASHSYSHLYFNSLSEEEKKDDFKKFEQIYQKVFGRSPPGFRAPSHVVDDQTIKIIESHGYKYDSSVVPHYPLFKKYRGYKGKAPLDPYFPSEQSVLKKDTSSPINASVIEIPVAGQLMGIPLAGAWIRKLPLALYKSFFMIHQPNFITLSMHSWDGLSDPGFYKKLESIIALLGQRGYHFQTGEQISKNYRAQKMGGISEAK
jgi:peptidoglycan/xylan/chitin deacetylase (PgdA/CDA1 family)